MLIFLGSEPRIPWHVSHGALGLAHRTVPLTIAVVTLLSGNKWYGNLKSYVEMKYKHINCNRNKLICALANCIWGIESLGRIWWVELF